MEHKQVGIILCIALILLLFVPTMQYVLKFLPESTLYGYTDPIPEKPSTYIHSFFDKSLQSWIEKKFNARVGLRAFLIRSFNEINFRLFREADNSRLKLAFTQQHGLYSNLSIDSLNYDVLHKQELEREYWENAKQLIQIQNRLGQQGKYFAVVIASSKAYIYPKELGKRLLIGGSNHIFDRAVDFGAILKTKGVHVIDSRPLLRKVAHKLKIETHPTSGLHWNYYSACLITKRLLANARTQFPNLASIDCGSYQRIMPQMNDVDVDGYSLLNIWSPTEVVTLTTYPTIKTIQNQDKNWQPNIVIIGDSFSDQMRFVLKKSNIYKHLVMSSYFKRRDVEDQDSQIDLIDLPEENKPFQAKLLADIAKSDIIILEMVDYNIHRENDNLYGFADYFLKNT